MMTNEWIDRLRALRVMPVIQIENAADAVPLAKVLVENGLPAAEITFRTAAAAESIRLIRAAYPQIVLCAGTVLTIEQVDAAIAAGADFVISPGFNPSTVTYCLENNIKMIPGVNNPSLVEQALELGVSALKFFPAEASGGINMLKSLVGPYSQIQLMPTGGVTPLNLGEYLAIPQVIACGGTWIAPTRAIANHEWDLIAGNVREVRAMIDQIGA
ncbi:bifunctional 4-hydroxy-2-oxoglutarate aldolase/2-dehydro-3-deoxy-phosphogluconate aldolase [Photobacterium phosphoreum]|jgi:2-dehydro-3-deoxyphosphogluconate aldolase/(4S)-4-hydroxy-2-oxoglutarate aldolase|uniref:bifunctional 4-hydroxy-2-oxoglutarate aldolase/2-dehydro-3-deoxy-phosphogluconate aldolase n=1 Tax=Photobacterium phosphoreum TaxID=659 RepID=UPI0005D3D838|nr:bifunctional 4-hydroxy-2-oxoglutarate aldolase/2-dehydro-3-deoxy-phosphogluconate aldolase [Photobacterium phosphoreum]KJF87415.1 2-dehydro-3-deoxyphosphogluconate aldolase [Photobacterium phosphoreum]MCD9474110.1 bifunctional 4-hydroxy-2-oxoglutarate aldolase/2-dehydro-3-deoxy-phosphogluconate aldolase [Photobacterium phosphoreum]MCD9477668.1 bifunctional 4-hydroxy-2-oxoglutarate aldolase/2-dehydro-3-deoxy-phosphogluconate aldolase [Photobacterium phosphoreum]MCD9482011.1 bifunctional 4-hyd